MELRNIIISFLSICFLPECIFALDQIEESFYVKPGAGTLSVERQVKDYTCKFSYAAQGGTHEEWNFSLEIVDGTGVMCTVERGVSSYIFFEHFKVELTGPSVSINEVDIKDSQRDNKNLPQDAYSMEKNAITSTEKFKNHLEKISVFAHLPRVDL